ncbi:penicillin-binding protein [Leptolyngbya boryana NIES-2135]|jgi:cell division protein FtsI (penicillin-binding protein 3)|uniref:Penicillin-binding protein n=1 Tax=Leptolyngbya boryana NIES-2135 TaxID=1973484 RepID=A0A1Z4JDD3_LEPBY|nr:MULTISPECIES: penicillin-binding protein 2 [Leptolyngbya]ULP31655.1 penicillin-binding protein 2 [Leptolyngbya boryana IU 594]BAY54746.1 penicillin-binding protein [Leptolyngbya boryana NIES-2135]
MSKRGKPTSSPHRPPTPNPRRSKLPLMVEQAYERVFDSSATAQAFGRFADHWVERFRTAQAKPSARRLFIVWAILVGATGLLALNLVRLQVFQAPDLLEQARSQQTTFLRPFVPRRPISDRNGNTLAIDRPVYTLYAHPIAFKAPKTEIATQLSSVLGTTPGELLQRFNSAESGVRVEYAISEAAADRIQGMQIDGLELAQQQQRLYPQQNLTADVVGYLDIDRIGQAGVEYTHSNLLERSVKSVRLSRTGAGVMMPDRIPGGFLQSDNLHLQLTIDSRIQRAALVALQPQLKKFKAKRGVVIVMDARDGGIRALVSDPSYDPNEFYKAKVEQFKNWALTDLYEPGSTFKPLNVAIALEAGAIQPNQVINDEGATQIDGWPIQNFDYSSAGARGPSTITQILEHSSNVGMVRIVQQMPRPTYYAWLEKIGLGKPTGIDLPFETAGQLKDQKTFSESAVDAATSSFGQGFSLTAMQLVQQQAILASGGKLLTPHVVQGLFDENGQPYWRATLPEPKQVFSPQTTQTVLRMMESVVQNGTGKAAQIPNYRIGGKTGTAQKAGPNGGYIEGAKITSFVSIFPIDAPRYVVAAVIDEPKGEDAFGSTVAAPIVKAVMEALITADKIPPSQPDVPAPSVSPSPNP